MKILIADDQKEVRGFLTDILSSQGYEVVAAADGTEALELYREHRPPFTLTDISMPGMDGIELLKQIKAFNNEAAVMLMTGDGTEHYAVEALRAGAVNYFNKPVDINELINTMSRYVGLATGYDYEHYAGSFLREERLRLSIGNDLNQVNHAVQMIVNHCRAIFPLSEIFTLRFGLYEMIVNAVEHGNLGIGYEEKTHALENNQYNELFNARAAEPDRARRCVEVECRINPERLHCRITDEGEGFDHSVYSNADDPAELFEALGMALHGRGIMLTSLQFDDLRFNDVGMKSK